MKASALKGKVFCITGTLRHSRKRYIEFIEELGGEFKNSLTKSVDYLVEGTDAALRYTGKHFDAVINDVRRISEQDLYAMAGMTLEDFDRKRIALRISRRMEYEASYTGKLDRLKAAAVASIGKIGNAMVLVDEGTRIYVTYYLKARKCAASVKCISAQGVAFIDRNKKSQFYAWQQLEAAQLMEVADYLAKLKELDRNSFRSRLRALNKEEEQRIKEAERIAV